MSNPIAELKAKVFDLETQMAAYDEDPANTVGIIYELLDAYKRLIYALDPKFPPATTPNRTEIRFSWPLEHEGRVAPRDLWVKVEGSRLTISCEAYGEPPGSPIIILGCRNNSLTIETSDNVNDMHERKIIDLKGARADQYIPF